MHAKARQKDIRVQLYAFIFSISTDRPLWPAIHVRIVCDVWSLQTIYVLGFVSEL